MARPLRVEYAGAAYHVMARGNRGAAIFQDDRDRTRFLETLAEACEKTGWRIHAYVLMGNHYHLLVETPEANLVAGMKWLQGTYTQRYNRRHKLFGHLFSGRYKSLIVDGSRNGYLKTVCDYVHLSDNDGLNDRNGCFEEGSAILNALERHDLRSKTMTMETYGPIPAIQLSQSILHKALQLN